MILVCIILGSCIISYGCGHIVDVEYSEEFFDPVGVSLVTQPNDQLVFDVLPTIPASYQRKFIFRFRVKSGGETHVALTDQYKGQSSMYDIVFGMNRNRYTAVRQCFFGNCEEVAAVLMPDAVSANQIQDLWIGFNWDQGMIAIGRGSDSLPALEARPSDPFGVNNFAFSTLHGTIGHWWFSRDYLVGGGGCGNLLYKVFDSYSYRYTLPVVPHSSAHNMELKFSAKGKADVRILLAPEVGLTDQKPAYEIIIGTSKNEVSEIRRCNSAVECCPVIASAQTRKVLKRDVFNKFHIIYNNGLLKVFLEGDDTPFLTIRDPYPISVRAIGYSQGPYYSGRFEFPAQGIASGLLVFDVEANTPYNLELPLVPDTKTEDLELSFLVKAPHSVLIVFSPDIKINKYSGRLYEIIIGGWNNKKSAIRFCKECAAETKNKHTPLDPNQFRQFRISIVGGKIDMYEGQHDEPVLSFQDPDPLNILAVGFTTSDGATGRFVFDTCNIYG